LILRHLERQINLGIPMSRLALDRGYETGAVHRGLELLGITGYIPAIQFSNVGSSRFFTFVNRSRFMRKFICRLRLNYWRPAEIAPKGPARKAKAIPHNCYDTHYRAAIL
ncbi:hypothetical protein, partial [Dysosmobacter sp.]|uniref:hypothetical protein n=1 Tax=Dysosmobacter sp. TaxID=2591382 RepID=UPI003AB72801